METWIRSYINCRSCQWKGALTACKTIADLTTGTRGCSIERFYRRWKVVCLCLQGNHRVEVLHSKKVRDILALWCKLFYARTFDNSYIVFVRRNDGVRM